ncbi:unnamed protein product, partial [Candidula unifasciata]
EALELAQRKMLRHIVLYSGTMDFEAYPRLIMIDLNTNSYGLKTEIHHEKDIKNKNNIDQTNSDSETEERCSKYCFRLLCESEQEEFLRSVSPYTARILAILKHCKINLPVLTSPEGEQLCRQIEEWCPRASPDFQSQYKMMVQAVLERDTDRTYGGLKRCHRPNGKILWLCEKHENSSFYKNSDKYHETQQPQDSETIADAMGEGDTEVDSTD